MIDKTFLEKLESMARQAVRPATIQDEHRRFIYDDNEGCYKLIERVVRQQGEVANVECLVDLVLEEARRRENVTGEWKRSRSRRTGLSSPPTTGSASTSTPSPESSPRSGGRSGESSASP